MHYISYFVFHILYMYIIVDVYCIHALYTICICIIMYLGSYPNTARVLCGASRFHAPGTGCSSTIRSASRAPRESRAFRAFSRVARTDYEFRRQRRVTRGKASVSLTWIILSFRIFSAYLCCTVAFACSVCKTLAHCLPLLYVFFCETCSLFWGQKNLMWLKRPQLLITKARIQLTFCVDSNKELHMHSSYRYYDCCGSMNGSMV